MADPLEADLKTPEHSQNIQTILDGKAPIRFGGNFLGEKKISGRKWSGTTWVYDISIPDSRAEGGVWQTELRVFEPSPTNDQWDKPPERQLTILTGKGEMELSGNQETNDAVYAEIQRQIQEQQAKKVDPH